VAGPAARILGLGPNAVNGAIVRPEAGGGRRGLLVLTAGPVGVTSTGPTPPWWSRPCLVERSGVLGPLTFRAHAMEGPGGLRAMPRAPEDWAARRRGELDRDRGSRQFSQAVDAQRRLNAWRPANTRTKADAFSSSGPGHWDARPSDVYGGLSMPHSEEPRSAYAPS